MKVTLQKLMKAKCALNGKEGDGVLVTLENGKERFFSWKGFQQFCAMELADAKPEKKKAEEATPSLFDPNGKPVATPVKT